MGESLLVAGLHAARRRASEKALLNHVRKVYESLVVHVALSVPLLEKIHVVNLTDLVRLELVTHELAHEVVVAEL